MEFGEAFSLMEECNESKNYMKDPMKNIPRSMTVTINTVGIDSRGKNAALHAKYHRLKGEDLIAAFRKGKGKWKIRAVDYSNNESR